MYLDDENFVHIKDSQKVFELIDYYFDFDESLTIEYMMESRLGQKLVRFEIKPICFATGGDLNEKEPLSIGVWDTELMYLKAYSVADKENRTFRVEKIMGVVFPEDEFHRLKIMDLFIEKKRKQIRRKFFIRSAKRPKGC